MAEMRKKIHQKECVSFCRKKVHPVKLGKVETMVFTREMLLTLLTKYTKASFISAFLI